jgi:hypothetical protein
VSKAHGFVLGYHGCDRDVGIKLVNGDIPFTHSEKDYDWLGHGIYFWESDPRRALEWAQWKNSVGHCPNPCVIGAVLDLGHCFDLVERENLDILSETFDAFAESRISAGLPLPRNEDSSKGASRNKVMRRLDCAVINHLHKTLDENELRPFDSVRGLFVEGEPAYEGGEIYRLTHCQIAIRNEACIKGVFFLR